MGGKNNKLIDKNSLTTDFQPGGHEPRVGFLVFLRELRELSIKNI